MKYFTERVEKLVHLNEIRIMEILESFQYGLAYIFVCFFLGVSLDFLFPKYDDKKNPSTIFIEVLFQCLAIILFVFYGRKLVKVMPFLFNLKYPLFGGKSVPKYDAYKSTEYQGEMIISIVLVATQTNLLKKIDHLSRNLYSYLFNSKRDAIQVLNIEEQKAKEKVKEEEQALEKDFAVVEKDIQAIEHSLK